MNRNFGFFAKKAGGQGTAFTNTISITPSSLGNVLTFNIDTDLPSGQELYYTLEGNVSTVDFLGDSLTGNLTLDINGNANVNFTANLEPTGNISEFYFNLRKTSISGSSLATSGNVILESDNAVNATGGSIEQIGNVVYHTFNTSNANFNISNTSSNAVIQFLIVGRGGYAGTGANNGGGGGGAGKVIIGKMWAMNDASYSIIPASSVNNQANSSITGVTANIIIAEPAGDAYPSNTFVSLTARRGGKGGDEANWTDTSGVGESGGSGGGAGTIANSPAVTYAQQAQGYADGNLPTIANGGLQYLGGNGNVSQYWKNYPITNSYTRNGGAGGGGATSQGLVVGVISSSGPGSYSYLNDGGNGGNAYVWVDGNAYAAGGPGQGWLGDPTNLGANGTTQSSIAGAGAGPGVPSSNIYGLVKFVYEMLPRNIEIL